MKMAGRRRSISVVFVLGAAALLAGCGATPFGAELAQNAAVQTTGAPMAIDATYQPEAEPVKTAALVEPAPSADAPVASAPIAPTINPPPSDTNSALLSPEEKAKVIAELEALAKKQGDELSQERAKAEAACDNLSANDLRKKMLNGEC